MRRSTAILLVALVTVSSSALMQVSSPAPRSLTGLLPAGPLVIVEAKDFSTLLHRWDSSQEKQLWLQSDNFQAFSRSRLYLRLQEANQEFASAAGFSPDANLLEAVAGRESALALYDIGKLEFLYVTRLPLARAMESVLWQTRGRFEPRSTAGMQYFVRIDPDSNRAVAFAATDDYLFLATREDILASALQLFSGTNGSAVAGEPWFERAVRTAGLHGDIRLVMNLEAIVRTPHFRSYWVQQNVSALRQYRPAISDVFLSAEEIREERVLLRTPSGGPDTEANGIEKAGGADLGALLHLVPDDYGLYRAWVKPTTDETLALLEHKLLAPRPGGMVQRPEFAPRVWLSSGIVGVTSDLETRIDQVPPKIPTSTFVPQTLRALLEGAGVKAILQVESSRMVPGDVFVEQQSVLVLLASSDWDEQAARKALLASVEGLWTTSQLGANWVERRRGAQVYYELDGLARLALALRGPYLVVADRPDALTPVLDRVGSLPGSRRAGEEVYAAQFRHDREADYFLKIMTMLDYPWVQGYGSAEQEEGRAPRFFSENLGSVSHTLKRVERASIVVRDHGSQVTQTVVYRLGP